MSGSFAGGGLEALYATLDFGAASMCISVPNGVGMQLGRPATSVNRTVLRSWHEDTHGLRMVGRSASSQPLPGQTR
ncbi:UNVERIFIED_CONTAM: hypothetical protein Sindi_2273900 [Sesamum indicum]